MPATGRLTSLEATRALAQDADARQDRQAAGQRRQLGLADAEQQLRWGLEQDAPCRQDDRAVLRHRKVVRAAVDEEVRPAVAAARSQQRQEPPATVERIMYGAPDMETEHSKASVGPAGFMSRR